MIKDRGKQWKIAEKKVKIHRKEEKKQKLRRSDVEEIKAKSFDEGGETIENASWRKNESQRIDRNKQTNKET